MALTIDSILAIDFSDIEQSVVLAKGLAPGKIIVQCYADGKVNIYGDAHRTHKTESITITKKDGTKRRVPPNARVIDDPKEKTACLMAQILMDHHNQQVEKFWPVYNDAENKRDTYKITEDPNYAPGSVIGKMKAKTCNDPRVLAAKAKADEFKSFLMDQAKAAREKMEERFIMDEESELMTKEMRIARAREMARKQVAEATGSKRAANG